MSGLLHQQERQQHFILLDRNHQRRLKLEQVVCHLVYYFLVFLDLLLNSWNMVIPKNG
jgi:hypothetical protein